MTQSAISQQVKSLESALGKPMFLRRARGLELTDAARGYLPSVQAAFALLVDGTRGLVASDPEQTLEIHANLAFSTFWLTPRLSDFLTRYPWININISTAMWDDEKISPYTSVEVRFGQGGWSNRRGERLAEQSLYPVCAPSIARGIESAEDILNFRMFDCAGLLQGWTAWLNRAPAALADDLKVNYGSTYVISLNCAMQGLGVALGHDILCEKILADGKLVKPFGLELPMKESYFLVMPPRRTITESGRLFRDWLLSQFE